MTPHRTTYARVIGTARATSAHPPVFNVPKMDAWLSRPRPSAWARLFRRMEAANGNAKG